MQRSWKPEAFVADDGSAPFERFVVGLSDIKYLAVEIAIDRVLAVHGIDLVRTEWLKPVGRGLHEFRVRHEAAETARMFGGDEARPTTGTEKVLLRLFVHFYGDQVVLLLSGFDKGKNPKAKRQQLEIRKARRFLTQFKERERRDRTDL